MTRHDMIEQQLRRRGIGDARVLAAMAQVPREEFVAPELRDHAYEDRPLPIAHDQTISQPYVVALMIESLDVRSTDRVLEIGTGSGYAAAVLGELAREVHTVERHLDLASTATERLARLGYRNVHVACGDGTLGMIEHAPYDAIVVAAGGPTLPEPLLRQLAIGGRLIIPVGPLHVQELVRITREGDDSFRREELGAVMFVPLIGAEGRHPSAARVSPA